MKKLQATSYKLQAAICKLNSQTAVVGAELNLPVLGIKCGSILLGRYTFLAAIQEKLAN